MNNVFVTGINSGCGKTVISAGIATVMQSLGYKTGIYKPIQTCAIQRENYLVSPDLAFVKMLDPYITTHSTYMFQEKLLPASINNSINFADITRDFTLLSEKTDTLLVEGTQGGLMTPLNKNLYTYHIPLNLKLPVLFIVSPSSDAVNNYFNEINTAKALGLNIIGTIINNYPLDTESEEIRAFPNLIENYCDIKVLGLIKSFKGNSVQSNTLITEILNGIELEDVFRMKIPKLNGY